MRYGKTAVEPTFIDLPINIDITGVIDAGAFMYNFATAFDEDTEIWKLYGSKLHTANKRFGDVVDAAAAGAPYNGVKYNVFHVYRWPSKVKASYNDFTERNRLWAGVVAPGIFKSAKIEYVFRDDDSMIPLHHTLRQFQSRHIIHDKATRFETKTSEMMNPGKKDPNVTVFRRKRSRRAGVIGYNQGDPERVPVHFAGGKRWYRKARNIYNRESGRRNPLDFQSIDFLLRAPVDQRQAVQFGYGTFGQFRALVMAFWFATAEELVAPEKFSQASVKISETELRKIGGLASRVHPVVFGETQRSPKLTYEGRKTVHRSSNKITTENKKQQELIRKVIQNAIQ